MTVGAHRSANQSHPLPEVSQQVSVSWRILLRGHVQHAQRQIKGYLLIAAEVFQAGHKGYVPLARWCGKAKSNRSTMTSPAHQRGVMRWLSVVNS